MVAPLLDFIGTIFTMIMILAIAIPFIVIIRRYF